MINWFFQLSDDNKIKFLGLIGAVIGFSVALWQYTVSQKWKKAEFLASEYKNFIGNDYVQKAFAMLDGFKINIPYTDSDGSAKFICFDKMKLKIALTNIHIDKATNRFYAEDSESTYIRLCIDKFLFKLGVMQVHIDSKLIKSKMLKPYVIYWLDLLTNKSDDTIDNDSKELIHQYIKDNKIVSLIKLFATFKKSI